MKRINLTILVFIGLLFLLFGFFIRHLGLYLDDATFALPIKAGTALEYASGYLKNFSFFRALALPYYYFVYSFFLKYGGIAHLIPLALYVLLLKLVYDVLTLQGASHRVAAVSTILVAAIPFWTEVYSWFAASNALIAYILLMFQIKLVIKAPDSKKSWFSLFALQFCMVLMYDTVFFMPLSLSYLWLKYSKSEKSWLNYFKRVGLLMLPAAGYLTYHLLFPPVVSTRIKFVSLGQIWQNWNNFFQNLENLFSGKYFESFWWERLSVGSFIIKESWISIGLFVLMIFMVRELLFRGKTVDNKIQNKGGKLKAKIFWLMSFFLSLLPISLQEHYLSFRLLVFPLSCLLLWLAFLVFDSIDGWRKEIGHFVKATIILALGVSVVFQVGLLGGYYRIYQDDLSTLKQINDFHTQYGFGFNNKATIYLHNFPVNGSGIYPYGDYGVSAFKYNWSAQSFNALEYVTWQEFVIDSESEGWFSGSQPRDEYKQIQPLLVIEYDGKCQEGSCLQVSNVRY